MLKPPFVVFLAAAILLAGSFQSRAAAPEVGSRTSLGKSGPSLWRRGLYVADATVLSQSSRRAALIDYVAAHHMDQLVLYNMGPMLRDDAGRELLSALILDLRKASARSVAAPIADKDRLQEVQRFEERHPEARFDAWVTENEYWNRCQEGAATTELVREECFSDFLGLVQAMREAALLRASSGSRPRIGAYLGYPTNAEIKQLSGVIDFVFLNYSVDSPKRAWKASHPRGGSLRGRFLSFAESGLEIWPIFYARGEGNMASWLRKYGLLAAEQAFVLGAAADPAFENARSKLMGFQYFADDALMAPLE